MTIPLPRITSPGTITDTPDEWMTDAVCAEVDPDSFFPEKGEKSREARKLCNTCPVATECLAYALRHDIRYGLYGGLTARERHALRRTT